MKNIFLGLILFFSQNIIAQKPTQPIRGTWITNVGSNVLKSKKNIDSAIQLCKKSGLNNVYVVVWNNGVTMYPSHLVEDYIGIRQSKIYGSRDPLKEIIDAGHKAGIKVHAWFEFGFAYNYGDSNCVWQQKYPEWIGRDKDGKALQKNKFYWWNSLHPEVQNFMNKLVLEVVKKYDIDGIQGDDRLPAMPSEGGYDVVTKKMYAQEHNGDEPPLNSKDSAWVQWRANKLSTYIKNLYTSVKAQKPNCIVSWAPSIYPWSKEQYLQDWPAWLNGGYADYILPQCYRYNVAAYEKIVKELSTQITNNQKKKIFPGMLTSLGDGYRVKEDLLKQMIKINRQYGFTGECMFYFETLRTITNMYK